MENEYEVEKILDSRVTKNKKQYKVKWFGYPESEYTWEPIDHLKSCQKLVDKYEQRNNVKKSSKTPEPA